MWPLGGIFTYTFDTMTRCYIREFPRPIVDPRPPDGHYIALESKLRRE
jgi:hypothetical protein